MVCFREDGKVEWGILKRQSGPELLGPAKIISLSPIACINKLTIRYTLNQSSVPATSRSTII
jgi:hypothetical protein